MYIKGINAIVAHLDKNPKRSLKYPFLDEKSLRNEVYSDAAFAMNYDQTSQLGYVILLRDKNKLCNLIYWNSNESKQPTRSDLGIKVMAFADSFDMAYTIKHDMEVILKTHIPLSMVANSESFVDVTTKATCATEKRLNADALTKPKTNSILVEKLYAEKQNTLFSNGYSELGYGSKYRLE